jgi:hypothetical protein
MNPDTILTVRVNDLDTCNNKKGYWAVRYPLSGESAALFVIDPVSGSYSDCCTVALDREMQPGVGFTATASDTPQSSGSEQRKLYAMVNTT